MNKHLYVFNCLLSLELNLNDIYRIVFNEYKKFLFFIFIKIYEILVKFFNSFDLSQKYMISPNDDSSEIELMVKLNTKEESDSFADEDEQSKNKKLKHYAFDSEKEVIE